MLDGAREVEYAIRATCTVGNRSGVGEVAACVFDAGARDVWELAAEDLDSGLLLEELLHHVGAQEAGATCETWGCEIGGAPTVSMVLSYL